MDGTKIEFVCGKLLSSCDIDGYTVMESGAVIARFSGHNFCKSYTLVIEDNDLLVKAADSGITIAKVTDVMRVTTNSLVAYMRALIGKFKSAQEDNLKFDVEYV